MLNIGQRQPAKLRQRENVILDHELISHAELPKQPMAQSFTIGVHGHAGNATRRRHTHLTGMTLWGEHRSEV
jgi:hypothetical protein